MNFIITLFSLLGIAFTAFGQQWPVSCQDYDSFVQFRCLQQQQSGGGVGGFCGLPSSCLNHPQVLLNPIISDDFFKWKQVQPSSNVVGCQTYDTYTQFKCYQQQVTNNKTTGGYCGRPTTCQNGYWVNLNPGELSDFNQWRIIGMPGPMPFGASIPVSSYIPSAIPVTTTTTTLPPGYSVGPPVLVSESSYSVYPTGSYVSSYYPVAPPPYIYFNRPNF